ncbi:hypothetical protein J6590_101045 [Homalodisca vitripennis]|nr:hypothetical protein J6590_101045 [Homalodisca vitripennis]
MKYPSDSINSILQSVLRNVLVFISSKLDAGVSVLWLPKVAVDILGLDIFTIDEKCSCLINLLNVKILPIYYFNFKRNKELPPIK